MKRLMLLLLITCLSHTAGALEIDEKLTLRVLRLSKTKKTMLINRGLEDGLVVGDHAKFFLTAGVMARGVVVKAAPTRSIWSIYRIIDGSQVVEDRVMNLKISTPLKLTEDASKSFRANVYANAEEGMTIPLARGADDLGSQLTEQERKDLESLGGNPPAPVYTQYNVGVDVNRTIEIWSLLHLNSFSTTTEQGSTTSSSGTTTTLDLSAGIAKYFSSKKSALGWFSLFALLHSESKEVSGVQGVSTSSSVLEGGVGINWHFLAHPLSYGRVIGYTGFAAGLGTTSAAISSSTVSVSDNNLSGGATFYSLTVGMKYFLAKGFGARVAIDYYSRSETYAFEDDADTTSTVSGPRFQVGLSYRF